MNILEKIKNWFEGDKDQTPPSIPLPNQGQMTFKSQSVPVETQAQETPRTLSPIPVDVAGIVPVWSMPSKIQTLKVTGNYGSTPEILINGSYKIKRVIMWAPYWGYYVGHEQDMKAPGYGYACSLPTGFPIVMEGCTEDLYFAQSAASISANTSAPMNVIVEYWAD